LLSRALDDRDRGPVTPQMRFPPGFEEKALMNEGPVNPDHSARMRATADIGFRYIGVAAMRPHCD